ncbi:DUF3108 domain-containing protein [Uliginosibacterium aquaticum]|uniref:DUF3108 domain-containing protein n=1 Tax=Uliginosibacterium aquaticum TaxID=2731212 RepID=A0ABX2IRS4_9RHOO|nr:DUF3108 domain-containing protein [Uliginosibacterium aquaticum]NSL56695.1 DUF3108 domain-containing protein [Uliginosibacterium aquaticum]
MRRQTPLIVACACSLAVHLGSLLSPGWELPDADVPEGDARRIEATLAAASPASAAVVPVAAPSTTRRSQPKPAPAAKPEPVPEASLPVAAESVVSELGIETLAEATGSAPMAEAAPEASSPAPSPHLVAKPLPRQGRVFYHGTVGGLVSLNAIGEASWEHDGARFQSRLTAGMGASDGMFDYRSTGRLAAGQLISETTSDRRMKKQSTGLIDQVGGKVTMQRGGDTRERTIKGLAVAMSALPQFLMTLDESLEKAALFVVGDFWVEDSVLIARGVEQLSLPSGKVETRHYESRANNGTQVNVWLAPGWRSAPVRIRIRSADGYVLDLKAVEVEIEGQVQLKAPETPSDF